MFIIYQIDKVVVAANTLSIKNTQLKDS